MSFEERFAAFGRALDSGLDSVRSRSHGSSLSEGAGAIRRKVSEGVTHAYERAKGTVADQGSRALTPENRSRLTLAGIVIVSVLLTAIVTRNLASGPPASDTATAASLSAIARERDQRGIAGVSTPQPVRAVTPAGSPGRK